MVWCLLIPATIIVTLGLVALRLDFRAMRPPRVSPRTILRGCISGTLILIAGCLAALAYVVHVWTP